MTAGKRSPDTLAGATGAGNVSQDCGPDAGEAIAGSIDTQAIRVELSERRHERNGVIHVAACHFATVESSSSPICKLARELLRLGADPSAHLSIWRGRTKCFHDAPLGRWAELTVEEGSSEPVFRRYKPFPGQAVASLRAKSGVRHGVGAQQTARRCVGPKPATGFRCSPKRSSRLTAVPKSPPNWRRRNSFMPAAC